MIATRTVPVDLAGRRYDIHIGQGLIGRAGMEIAGLLGRRRIIVLTDETVGGLYLARLMASFEAAGLAAAPVILPPGEESKNFRRFPDLIEKLLDTEPDRRSLIVALGGGVIGDLAGFAAATLLRGIDFVQIPTTLLAQIDSSVGGKTGANTRHGKNLVGAFHQPRLVLADLGVLDTLPHRELLAGYAEMVKYGLLGDAAFFGWLEENGERLIAGDREARAYGVALCCRMKAEIVAEDEREAGRRALLNLGHTFGHAFEAETGFGPRLLHGEGVALGLVLAASLSERLGTCRSTEAERIRTHLSGAGLPVSPIEVDGGPFTAGRLIGHMRHDKKTVDGRLTLITLDGIGRAQILPGVGEEIVRETLIEAGSLD